ncbi:hypothetical protein RhiirA4_485778 [Rhizophagus irregularis]|uniref:Uncharacterized protein n=1 Tax=Rhizophagus irregularis TaxID=588596 RepID=A0A2I1HQK7_9GLOM|nr:hypothetical protein RhiirA4_485778 [Rhizophagus irregularis]
MHINYLSERYYYSLIYASPPPPPLEQEQQPPPPPQRVCIIIQVPGLSNEDEIEINLSKSTPTILEDFIRNKDI